MLLSSYSSIVSGIGKRKTSLAKIYLNKGSNLFFVNKKLIEDKEFILRLSKPLNYIELKDLLDIFIFVKGGGISSQIDAIHLALSKALIKLNINYKSYLKKNKFLKLDTRIKERRKYGLKKARKAPQYSKR